MTTLINLWGGPGCGKSTTAAEVFSILKKNGHSAELVTEYVKAWAWRDRKIGPFDDVYITAKQLQREAVCYGKVDFIVTDSPIGLGALYEQLYKPGELMMSALCVELRRRQDAAGLNVLDFLLARAKPYVQAGRWEDEAAARRVDDLAADMLAMLNGYYSVAGATGVLAVLRTKGLLP
jgi:hypothetical protein